jgi:hypothetical protein
MSVLLYKIVNVCRKSNKKFYYYLYASLVYAIYTAWVA